MNTKLLPSIVYKYRGFDSNYGPVSGEEAFRQIIVDKTIFFSRPSALNDPFECRPHFHYKGSSLDFLNEAKKLKSLPGWPKSNKSSVVEIARRMKTGTFKVPVEALHNETDQTSGIFSLSSKTTDIRLWSYYADHHRGYAFGFNASIAPWYALIYPVDYGSDYPTYNLLDRGRPAIEKLKTILLPKHTDWEFESEYRAFFVEDAFVPHVIQVTKLGTGWLVKFEDLGLREIIFGAKCDAITRNKIKEIASKSNTQIVFREARLKERQFGLDIVDLS